MSLRIRPRQIRSYAARGRWAMFCAALLSLTLSPSPAWAQTADFGPRPVRILNQFGPGGGADNIVRPLLDRLAASVGVAFVIEHKPGAAGAIAAQEFESARPDGHTLIIDTQTLLLNTVLRKVAYRHEEWEPVVLLGIIPLALLVRKDLPGRSVPELVSYARLHPDQLTYATLGPGSAAHLAALRFQSVTGIRMLAVPYKGTNEIHTDLIGKRIDIFFDGVSQAVPRQRDRLLDILGFTTQARLPIARDIPTFQEQGVDLVLGAWFGIAAPKGTPANLLSRLSEAFATALSAPDYRERMSALGIVVAHEQLAEFGRFRRADLERWQAIIDSSKLKLD